jgi:hypothetical protein
MGLRSINSSILFRIRKNCLVSGRNLLLYQFTIRAIKLTVASIVGYHCYQFLMKLVGIISVGFDVTDQLLIRFLLHSSATGEKLAHNGAVYQLFTDFEKAHDSVRREVLYGIFIEFGVPMKLIRPFKCV